MDFFSLWRRGTHRIHSISGGFWERGFGFPNSSPWWRRLEADTHLPNGFRGMPKHRKSSSAEKTCKEQKAPAPQGVTQRQCSLVKGSTKGEAMKHISWSCCCCCELWYQSLHQGAWTLCGLLVPHTLSFRDLTLKALQTDVCC